MAPSDAVRYVACRLATCGINGPNIVAIVDEKAFVVGGPASTTIAVWSIGPVVKLIVQGLVNIPGKINRTSAIGWHRHPGQRITVPPGNITSFWRKRRIIMYAL